MERRDGPGWGAGAGRLPRGGTDVVESSSALLGPPKVRLSCKHDMHVMSVWMLRAYVVDV